MFGPPSNWMLSAVIRWTGVTYPLGGAPANARFISLCEGPGGVEDVELALAREAIPEPLRTQNDWN